MKKNDMQSKQFVNYDPQADVLYVGLKKGVEEEFIELAPEISVEIDSKGKILGFEILNASRVLSHIAEPLQRQAVSHARGL